MTLQLVMMPIFLIYFFYLIFVFIYLIIFLAEAADVIFSERKHFV